MFSGGHSLNLGGEFFNPPNLGGTGFQGEDYDYNIIILNLFFLKSFVLFWAMPRLPRHIRNTMVMLIRYGGGKTIRQGKNYGGVSKKPGFPGEIHR